MERICQCECGCRVENPKTYIVKTQTCYACYQSARLHGGTCKRGERRESNMSLVETVEYFHRPDNSTVLPNGCRVLTRHTSKTKGRSLVRFQGGHKLLHKLVLSHKLGRTDGSLPDGLETSHLCGNGKIGCFESTHLVAETPPENRARDGRGEDHHKAKLSNYDAWWIKHRCIPAGLSDAEIGDIYGVSQNSVCLIRTGRSWGWLQEHPAPELKLAA